MNESDLDRWKSKISFKSIIVDLLHGNLKPLRNWCWKHFFPRSWANLEERLQVQIEQLYDNVDNFLAYGDTIQKTGTLTIMGSPNDTLEWLDTPEGRIKKALIQRGFIQPRTTFSPEQITRAYRTISTVLRPIAEAIQPIAEVMTEVIKPFLEIISIPLQRYLEIKSMIENNQVDPDLRIGVEEYIEFLKNDIAAGCGIPQEELFSAQPVIAGSGAEISERFFFDQWHYARGHGRTTARRLSRIYQNLWNNNIPQTEEQEDDFLTTIKNSLEAMQKEVGLERWQSEMMQNPAPSPESYSLWRDLRMQQLAQRRLRGEVVWSGTLRATDVSLKANIKETIETRHKLLIIRERKAYVKKTMRKYLLNKARKVKKERNCFNKECKEGLDFCGFIDTNTPKSFIEYYRLKELWNSKYIQLYCCSCYKEMDKCEVKCND